MTYRDALRCEFARRDFWEYCKLLAPDFYKEDRKFLKDKYAHDDAQDATTGVYENLPKKKESNYTPIFM